MIYIKMENGVATRSTKFFDIAKNYEEYITTEYEDYTCTNPKYIIENNEVILNPHYDEELNELLKKEVREKRNILLSSTDKFVLMDFPLSKQEKDRYIKYRAYLRDITKDKNFPNVNVLMFEDWKHLQ